MADSREAISVIVPVRDDVEGLRALLEAIAAQERQPDEVIVVDSASSRALPRPEALVGSVAAAWQVVRVEQPGSYRARNAGIEAATGSILAFTDADCRPAPDWLGVAEALLSPADGPAAIGGRIEVTTAGPGRRTFAEAYEVVHSFPQHHYVARRNFAATANLVVNRSAIDLVGRFDPTLTSAGDLEWGTRAGRLGLRLQFAPDLLVEHPARRTMGELHAKRRRILAGHLDLQRLEEQAPRYSLLRLLAVPVRTRWRVLCDPNHDLATRVKAVLVAQWLQWASIPMLMRHRR